MFIYTRLVLIIPRSSKKYVVVFLGSLFYLYEFFIRVSPSVMTQDLMAYFGVAAAQLSLMSAAFFYAYMPMQVVAGLLGDRFGPRKLLTAAAALCGLMTCLFVLSPSLWVAGIARFFMGLTASCAYIAPMILASHWFDQRFFPMIIGSIQLLGSFGAYLAGAPLASAMVQYPWTHILSVVGLAGLALSILIFTCVQDHPKPSKAKKQASMSAGLSQEWLRLKKVCRIPATWVIAFTGFAFWAPMSVFAELWGPSFLARSECIALLKASEQMKWLWLGVAIGGPLLGWVSHRLESCRIPMIYAFLVCLVTTVWLVYGVHHSLVWVDVALFAFGFSCAGQCLTFGLVRQLHANTALGTAIGLNNMAVILGGTILQPLAGWILDLYRSDVCQTTAYHFSLSAYQHAFVMMPTMTVLGFLVTLFYIKENNN